jgi:hypothetical protein
LYSSTRLFPGVCKSKSRPIAMVIMYFANARITCRGEFKARSDRTVDVKAPFLNVAVPPSLHLGRQRQLTFGLVDSDAGEIPAVITGAGRLWRSVRPSEAGRHIRAVASNTMLFVLPVTIWTTGIVVIFDVQDGDVRLIKHALAPVIDESKLSPDPLTPDDAAGRIARKRQIGFDAGHEIHN